MLRLEGNSKYEDFVLDDREQGARVVYQSKQAFDEECYRKENVRKVRGTIILFLLRIMLRHCIYVERLTLDGVNNLSNMLQLGLISIVLSLFKPFGLYAIKKFILEDDTFCSTTLCAIKVLNGVFWSKRNVQ